MPRDAVIDLLAAGGIALNVWDYDHGPADERPRRVDEAARLLLGRRPGRADPNADPGRSCFGADYPLFVDAVDDALPLLRAVLADPDLYRVAGERAFAASRTFTYPAVHRLIAPYLATPSAG